TAKHEVAVPEELLGARLVKVGEEDLCLSNYLVADRRLALDRRAFGTEMQHLHVISELLSRDSLPVKTRPGNLGQDNLFAKLVHFADQDSPGLCQPFQDQRARHYRV